jgi:SAM-dependent methyltransferase
VTIDTTGTVDPYANLAACYDHLVEWVVEEQGESPREHMGAFLEEFWQGRPGPVRTVLEICCGTGLMLSDLKRRGYTVTGLDRSPAMLEQARARLGPQAELIRSELPHIPAELRFDAVISAATGLNYLSETELGQTLASVAQVLPPGGTFVFDLFGRAFFDRFFDAASPTTVAAELEDVSYIWTFTTPATRAHFDMVYIQFRREPGAPPHAYTKSRDLHRFHPLTHDAVRRLAAAAGFTGAEVHDNYTARPSGPETLFDTWTLVRAA